MSALASPLRGLVERLWWSFLPELSGGKVTRLVCSGRTVFYRVRSPEEGLSVSRLLDREPWFAGWLAGSLRPGDVLYDLGAGDGTYALLAAVLREARVIAVEPDSVLFERFSVNLTLNEGARRILPVPASLAAGTGLRTGTVDGEECQAFSFALDDLRASCTLPEPDHLRLDVTRTGLAALDGARRTIGAPGLRTALVRCRPGDRAGVAPSFKHDGFVSSERHEVRDDGPAGDRLDELWVRRG